LARAVLLVAAWGKPLDWRPARYRYAGAEAEARTSLEAVARKLLDEGHEVHGLILVSNTLACAAPSQRSGCAQELSKWPPGLQEDYSETMRSIREAVEEWLTRCSGAEALAEMLRGARLQVEVLHGHGFFDGVRYNASCPDGSPMEVYRAEAEAVLAEALAKTHAGRLVVDLTHGINYMPAALLEASRTAALSYAVAAEARLELTVVNSEPYPRGTAKPPELEVYTVEHAAYDAEPSDNGSTAVDEAAQRLRRIAGQAHGKKPHCYTRQGMEHLERLGRKLAPLTKNAKNLLEDGVASANIALYAMPLAALNQAAQPPENPWGNALELLRSLLKEAVDNTIVTEDSVEPLLLPKPSAVEALLLGAALHQRLRHAAEELKGRDLAEEGASLEELRRVITHLGSLYEPIASAELSSLERKCLKKEKGAGRCEIEVGENEYPGLPCIRDSIDPRNLRAHAGLEKNTVEAMLRGGELRLRYRRGCWQLLRRSLSSPGF